MEAHKDMEAHRDTLLSEEPLLENSIERRSEKIIDIKGVKHHTTDSWRACTYILVTECFEELAYYGIQFNLVTFLKTVLHENNVTAARNYSNWQGTCYIAPLVGAIIADSYLGRYLTTVVFFTVYLVVSTQN
jgi:peptide/histidine transporter 3/4